MQINPNILKNQFAKIACSFIPLNTNTIKYLPLAHIDYQINIKNNTAKVLLNQHYINTTQQILDIQYLFPIIPNTCIFSFKASFDNNVIDGIIKQKQQANNQFQKEKLLGKQVALTQYQDKDLLKLKIGNLNPNSTLKIIIQYLQELEVAMNTFWRFSIPKSIAPNQIITKFTWSFKINLDTTKPCIYHQATSHKLQLLSQNENKTQTILVMPQQCNPISQFIFLYTTQDFQCSTYTLGKNDTNSSAIISFIPKFHDLKIDDAYQMQLKNNDYEIDLDNVCAEYIFILDRSGSMAGSRINKAKQALTFFIKSLPIDCYFNIFCFGSNYQTIFKNSKKYEDNAIRQVIDKINIMKADLGGTEIKKPLEEIFKTNIIKGYPKQIFLLTDGQVNNEQDIFRLIKKNTKFTRVHTIGIGSDASKSLIQGCAQRGKGVYTFIRDSQNVSSKIIQILNRALSPVIKQFNINYDESVIQSIIPNPKQMPYILKNEAVTIYIIFKATFNGVTSITLNYFDTFSKKQIINTIYIDTKQPGLSIIDKMVHYKTLSILQSAIQDINILKSDIVISQMENLRQYIIKKSIKNQILSKFTSFICVGKNLVDGKYQEYLKSQVRKVNLNQQKINLVQNLSNSNLNQTNLFGGMNIRPKGNFQSSSYSNNNQSLNLHDFFDGPQYTSSQSPVLFNSIPPINIQPPLKQNQPNIYGNVFSGSIPQQQTNKNINNPPPPSFGAFRGGSFGNSPPQLNQNSQQANLFGNTSSFGTGNFEHPSSPPLFGSKTNTLGYTSAKKNQIQLFQSQKKSSIGGLFGLKSDDTTSIKQQKNIVNKDFLGSLQSNSFNQQTIIKDTQNFKKVEESKIKKLDAKQSLQLVINLQFSDGHWNKSTQLIKVINLSQSEFEKLQLHYQDQTFLMTVLTKNWLQKYHNNTECLLIIKKANSWTNKKALSLGIKNWMDLTQAIK